jgi:hemin uptake protein HemP
MEDLKEVAALPANATALDIASGQPVFTTEQLFSGTNEIAIVHQGLTYRLRITRQGKLVLNK